MSSQHFRRECMWNRLDTVSSYRLGIGRENLVPSLGDLERGSTSKQITQIIVKRCQFLKISDSDISIKSFSKSYRHLSKGKKKTCKISVDVRMTVSLGCSEPQVPSSCIHWLCRRAVPTARTNCSCCSARGSRNREKGNASWGVFPLGKTGTCVSTQASSSIDRLALALAKPALLLCECWQKPAEYSISVVFSHVPLQTISAKFLSSSMCSDL